MLLTGGRSVDLGEASERAGSERTSILRRPRAGQGCTGPQKRIAFPKTRSVGPDLADHGDFPIGTDSVRPGGRLAGVVSTSTPPSSLRPPRRARERRRLRGCVALDALDGLILLGQREPYRAGDQMKAEDEEANRAEVKSDLRHAVPLSGC